MTYEIHTMDCRLAMSMLIEPGSIDTCVTSPPYFGLRDYGHDGQIGLEQTPEEYVAALVDVFRHVRTVLRDDGTVWLNLGDSYATGGKWGGSTSGKAAKALHGLAGGGRGRTYPGLADKQLLGIPWRVAFALQADGWYLRQDIIWSKPNPMPESVTDRCTKAHEYIFLLSKSPRYYFDAAAIAEKATYPLGAGNRSDNKYIAAAKTDPAYRTKGGLANIGGRETRNRRSVWTVTTKPFRGAHFATFPPDLIEPCILAGSPAGGTVLDPFGGTGTVAYAAAKHGRDAILLELDDRCGQWTADRMARLPA